MSKLIILYFESKSLIREVLQLHTNGECINRKGSKLLTNQVTPNLIIFSDLRKPLQPLWIIHCVGGS